MKTFFTLITLTVFGFSIAFSQCNETPVNRVLLVGDSWANFMNIDQTITDALRNSGHSDKKYTSSLAVAENGADTWDFVASGGKQQIIQDLIDANPEIDIVHLSIGGNDLLGEYHVSWDQEQVDSLLSDVGDRLTEIIEFLKSTRPGMHVFWAGYTYPNFQEVIEGNAFGASNHPFFDLWDGMGQPTALQLNQILVDYSDTLLAQAMDDPLLDFVPAQAILQHIHGQTSPLGVAPGGTFQPLEADLPYGFPEYPSNKSTMRNQIIFTDCFHLSPGAYLDMLNYQTLKFYQKFFMDDLYILSDGGMMDGSVSSSGDVTESIMMGETGGNEVAAVLSFDTQNMADTSLGAASIFLRLESVAGINPISGNELQIKMISGNFGATANVEADDFMATADVTDIPCRFGSNGIGKWIRIDLTDEMLMNLNNSSNTQFIVSVPGFTGGTVTFSDASDPDLAPILNLEYGESEPDGIREHIAKNELPVYPIPTTGSLTIGIGQGSLVSVDVLNILGEIVLQPEIQSGSSINISGLPSGSYVIRITSEAGVSAKRIVKR